MRLRNVLDVKKVRCCLIFDFNDLGAIFQNNDLGAIFQNNDLGAIFQNNDLGAGGVNRNHFFLTDF